MLNHIYILLFEAKCFGNIVYATANRVSNELEHFSFLSFSYILFKLKIQRFFNLVQDILQQLEKNQKRKN